MGETYNQHAEGDGNTQIIQSITPDPLKVYSGDLRELILAFRNVIPPADKPEAGYIFAELEVKNKNNGMSPEYFSQVLRDDLPFFHDIDEFLHDPRSNDFTEMYNGTAKDLQGHFLSQQDRFKSIDKFLMHSYNTIFEALQVEFGRERGKIRIFLHHMYWNCSIGV
ncbi:ABC-three component system protein [Maridesulfovibrio sp.]|uniref:ABC-three component system protein n=1 Tax=Maridesulfovibrio sp. TaxID=2795000 RepID=UPI003B00EA2D